MRFRLLLVALAALAAFGCARGSDEAGPCSVISGGHDITGSVVTSCTDVGGAGGANGGSVDRHDVQNPAPVFAPPGSVSVSEEPK